MRLYNDGTSGPVRFDLPVGHEWAFVNEPDGLHYRCQDGKDLLLTRDPDGLVVGVTVISKGSGGLHEWLDWNEAREG